MRTIAAFVVALLLQGMCLQAHAATHVSTVLMGDSEMYGFLLYPSLTPSDTVNLGIGGSVATAALSMAPVAASYTPNKIFVLTGTNDVQQGTTIAFSATYDTMLTTLEAASPGSKIYVSALFPVNWTDFGAQQQTTNDQVSAYNGLITSVVSRHAGVTYLDFTSSFRDSKGNLNAGYSFDGIHLNEAGYKLWGSLLSKYF